MAKFLFSILILYDLYIADLRQLDGKQKDDTIFSTQPHLNQFFSDLGENYSIRRPFFIDGKTIKIRDLQGPDKKNLFNNIDLKVYSKNNEKIKKVDQLWKDFMEIINQVKTKSVVKRLKKRQINGFLILQTFMMLNILHHICIVSAIICTNL